MDIGLGPSIQLRLQPRDQILGCGQVRPRRARRRHQPRAQFSHDLFPNLRVRRNIGQIDRIERDRYRASLFRFLRMTRQTISLEESLLR